MFRFVPRLLLAQAGRSVCSGSEAIETKANAVIIDSLHD